ncbi:two-partner secretion domain-containing protein [Comamonas testosteroni]|uniref:Filamentous hemagglutinin n=1 Tax=Comamonas testosteroni TaxID=285 RepID=A0A8B4S8Q5_COMTE|nr:hemagglutinin repeat-containing protein [Comamonas testosteroni]EHN63592.1 Hemagglutinin-like protein [Comamonas testosteroni ATCC 11996]QQN68114.1 hemagglutinin repeat-containing protein [Comamonas testosteroni]SUY78660.1 Filamentous hemagglutinin [Comamonas testosteroni]
MNKNLYRIIFNRALGLFQVVAEIARCNRAGASSGTTAGSRFLATLRPLCFALALALVQAVIVPMANAQVVADPNAPGNQRPTVLEAANGVPLVNIQTPSAAGVSRNTYKQFDVDQQGAILNNSRTNTRTELGGWVQGNPWLGKGTARVILNEVNSSAPSNLRGYVEVAGDRAQLVIANPAGISCDGCGFINADRATLATGKPIINGGSLEGYRVGGGAIQVQGKGMDASGTNYTDLIARSVEANAGIWAQQLRVTTGSNEVSVDHAQVRKTDASGEAPAFALDVGALGGMYSQKIVLVGTEQGVGMRNAGSLGAHAGQLVVTADGRLENSGTMQARTDTRIDVSGGLANSGTLSAGRELVVSAPQDIDNSEGTLNARRIELNAQSLKNRGGAIEQTGTQDLTLHAGRASNRDGGRIGLAEADPGNGAAPGASTGGGTGAETGGGAGGGEGLPNDGSASEDGGQPGAGVAPLANGALNIAAALDNDGGRIMAGGDIDLTAKAGLDNDTGHLGARRLDVSGDLGNRKGEIKVAADARIAAGQLNNDAGLMQLAGPVALSAQDFSNRAGIFQHSDKADTHIKVKGQLDNSEGTLASNAKRLSLDAGQLVNIDGHVAHAGDGGLQVNAGAFSGAGGETATAGAASLRLGDSDHRKATLSAAQIDLDAQSFDNRGGKVIATGNQTNRLEVAGTLDNGDGTIASNADLGIRAGTLGNAQGNILHAGDGRLDIDAGTLRGEDGSIASNGALDLKGQTTDLTGAATQAKAITVNTGMLTTAKGTLVASGSGPLDLKVRGAMDNRGGTVAGNGTVDLRAKSLDNTGGTLSAAGTDASRIAVTDQLDNTDGILAAAGDITVKAGELVNRGGTMVASGDSALAVNVDGTLDNSAGGTLAAGGDMALASGVLYNRKGTIQHTGSGALTVATGDLAGAGGTLVSRGALDLKAGRADLRGGTTQADRIAIAADTLSTAGGSLVALGSDTLDVNVAAAMDNNGGTIAGNGAVRLAAQSLTNRAGRISAAGAEASKVQIAQRLDNSGGAIATAGDMQVKAGDLINRGGSLVAAGGAALSVEAKGLLDNSGKGMLAAGGDMAVSADTLDNRDGSIQHAGEGVLQLAVNTLQGESGAIATNGGLELTGEHTDLRDASTLARRLSIDTGTLTTAGGNLSATGSDLLVVRARERIDNTGGTIAGNGGLDMQTRVLGNAHGTISAAGSAPSRVDVTGAFDNTGGALAVAGDTSVAAGTLHNQGGSVVAAGDAALKVVVDRLLDNSGKGTLAAGGNLAVGAAVLDNRGGAVLHSGKGTADIVAAELQGAGGSIASNGALAIGGDTTDLSGGSTFGEHIRIETGRLLNSGGKLIATGTDLLRVHARDGVTNSGGTIASNGALDLHTASLGNQDGKISAAGSADTRVEVDAAFDNRGGELVAGGSIHLKAGDLSNQGGTVLAAERAALTVNVANRLDNSAEGTLGAGGDLAVSASVLDNRIGTIQHAGDGTATIAAGDLQGARGTIASNGALTLSGTTTDVGGGTTQARQVAIDTGTLKNVDGTIAATGGAPLLVHARDRIDNNSGTIAGNGTLDLQAGALSNQAGKIQAAGSGDSRLSVTGQFDNQRGSIVAAGNTTVTAGSLHNQGGTVAATGQSALSLYVNGLLDNSAKGTLAADDDLTVSASVLDNRGGAIQHAGDGTATVLAGQLQGAGGSIASNGTLDIGGTLTDFSGGNTFGERIRIHTGRLLNAGGKLIATGADQLLVRAVDGVDNSGGTIAGNGALDLQAGSLANRDGTVQAAGDAASRLHVAGTLDNTGGRVLAAGETTVNAGELLNQRGKVQTSGDAGLSVSVAGTLDNRDDGLIASAAKADLSAGSLDNRGAAVNAAGPLTVAVQLALDNRGGKLVSAADLGVTAATLDNRDAGLLVSTDGKLDVGTLGRTENAGGTLQGGGDVRLANTGLGNAGGSVLGANVEVDTRLASLDNAGGSIASTTGTLDLDSGALNNAGGLLQSAQGMRVDTHGRELDNTDVASTGGILSGDTLVLSTGSLKNRSGIVQSQGDFIARTGAIDNTAGQLGSNANVDIGAVSIGNASGKVQAGRDLTANFFGVANNDGGLMVATGGLALNAAQILNRDTQSADADQPLGLQGDSVVLTAHRTDNTAGTIAADSSIAIQGTGEGSVLDNTLGNVTSGGSIELEANRVINQLGTLLAGKSLGVSADSLGGDGSLLSKGDLSLILQQDFTNLKEITVNGRALISTGGLLTNHSLLQAGDLEVRGANVNNTATGEMSGGRTTVVARDTLTNRGLIDGSQTRIDAGTLDNVGTGRIYGDHLAIKGGTVNNREEGGRAAVIAARQRLDIGAGFLNNREQALIFSAGSGSDAMNIGGTLDASYQATGRAGLILNDSATIESLGGLSIDSARLLNRNLHFRTELAQVGGPTRYLYIQPKGDPGKYSADDYQWESWSRAGRYRHKQTGAEVRDWTQYDVIRTEYETQVVESAPALIRAGGSMSLRGDELLNDKSQIIAGGILQGDLDRLNNVAAIGEHITSESGTSQYSYSKWRGGRRRYYQRRWDAKIAYNPADTVQTVDLGVSKVVQNAAGGGSGFDVDGRQIGQVDASVGGSASAGGSTGLKQITEVQAELNGVSGPGTASGGQVTGGNGPALIKEQAVAGNSGPGQTQVDDINTLEGPGASQATAVDTLAGPGQASGQDVVNRSGPGSQQGGSVDGASGDAPAVIRTVQVDTDVPANSLFRTGPSAGGYLIETDPRFADYRNWLSSDYMLSQLGYDPATTHKRLGDGFYEQKLVRDQIGQLTGRRFLDGYASDEVQYRALLEAGSTYARAWNLRPGVALSAAQMAQLTSDIVWLVERDVRLADGTTTRALVPQVYVRVKPGDIDGGGSLLAANAVDLNLQGDLVNSGTIAGRTAVKLTGENLRNLGGRITGDAVALNARTDIDNIGGTLDASSTLQLNAGRDLNVVSTTRRDVKQAGLSDFSRTNLDRVAGLYVSKPQGTLVAMAGRDANLIAAQLINSGKDGQTTIAAGRDLTLGTVKIAEQENNVRNASNYLKQGYVQDVGTNITAAGDVRLQAGRDLSAIAANVTSEQGALVAVAHGDVNILAGEASSNWAEGRQHKSRSLLGSSRKTTRDSLEESRAVSSTFSGSTVAVQGQNVTVTGSNVVSDADTVIVARNDLTIQAATETSSESHFKETRKSGFLYNGGIAFTVGNQMQSADRKDVSTHAAASTVGSTDGDVNLVAGNQYQQMGSHVLAPKGDIDIHARKVDIIEARETGKSTQESKFRQSGLTVALTSPVISAVQTGQQMKSATDNTSDTRMKALAAATTGLAAVNAYAAVSADPKAAGGLNISITAGSSKSGSKSTTTYDTAAGSTVAAGGDVRISATGAGQDSDITVRGSSISTGGNTHLKADGDIKLLAAENTVETKHSSSNSSAGVGVAISVGQGGASMGITANASRGKGKGEGRDVTWTNSLVSAGERLTLESGADTNLKGAVVSGKQVVADVGGDLNIESRQDSSSYASRNQTVGGSLTISPAGVPIGGGLNAGQSKVNSNYQSVTEQSGIQAGDGGFQVSVKGDTDLKGAVIASNQTAIDQDKNRFSTEGALTTSDLHNSAHYEGQAVGVNASVGNDAGKFGVKGVGAGVGQDSGSAQGTTTAGISDIAGDQSVRTGDATGIERIFDQNKVQRDIDAQVAITAEFGKQASKAVGDFAGRKYNELKDSDPVEAAKWSEGGAYRVALHAVVGGLSGGVQGAMGATAASAAAPSIEQLQQQFQSALQNSGLGEGAAKVLASLAGGATATTIGAVASSGSAAGAAAAFNSDMNNRQLHPSERLLARTLAARSNGKYAVTQIEDALRVAGNTETAESIVAGMVVDPSERDAIYDSGAVWTIGSTGQMVQVVPKQPAADLMQFIQSSTAGKYDWYMPSSNGNELASTPRDRLTGAPLDEQGRYSQIIILDGKKYQPKYFPCAKPECLGSNLDSSDPGTNAYIKAMDAQIFKDISTGANYATLMTPAGASGQTLAALGLVASAGSAVTDSNALDELLKYGSQKGSEKLFVDILGHTPANAARAISIIDLSGGWSAFVERIKIDILEIRNKSEN